MKKYMFFALLLCGSALANAATIRVICCDGSIHDFYGIGEESYSKYVTKPGSYEMYLRNAAKGYCPEDCIRSVFELKGSALRLSAQKDNNRQDADCLVADMAGDGRNDEPMSRL